MQGLDMEQPFTAEAAFTKNILVNLGARGAVGVNAALPGKQPVVGRAFLR